MRGSAVLRRDAEGETGPSSPSRGTTIALNYVLVLGISTLLVSGLIVAGGVFVEDQRENVIQGELNVIGTHLSGNIAQVDRYVIAGDEEATAHVNQTFPRQVSKERYEVRLEPNGNEPAQLVLSPRSADITVTINATVSADVEASTARGGKISVYYDGDGLVIAND